MIEVAITAKRYVDVDRETHLHDTKSNQNSSIQQRQNKIPMILTTQKLKP